MKIEFVTGSMFSGKSREIIDFLEHFEAQNKKALVLKPQFDTRDFLCIKSRDRERQFSAMGIRKEVNPFTQEEFDVFPSFRKGEFDNIDVIVVDEAQFLSNNGIRWLVQLSDAYGIPLILAGLTYDFRGEVFPAIQYLADNYGERVKVYQLKAICFNCQELRLTHSCRVLNGEIVLEGAVNEIGDSEKYIAICDDCLKEKLERKGE